MGIKLKWLKFVWLLSMTLEVKSQCSTNDEIFNSPEGGPFFSSEKIVPLNMLEDMLGYVELLRTEWWFMSADNLTVTMMGDDSCAFLGKGIGIENLSAFDPNWTVPLLTNVMLVGDKVFIPGKISTFATLDQFTELAKILQLKTQIELKKHPKIMLNLSSRTLTNFDRSVTNSCMMVDLTVNLQHQMEVMLISLAEIWDQFISIMVSFGQETSIEVLRQCCGSKNLTIQALLFLPDPLFSLCTKQLLTRNQTKHPVRTVRSVSLMSQLFGDGNEILRLEGTLAEAISRFNSNFKKEEKFDKQVQESLVGLDSEMNSIINNEEKLINKMLQLHVEIQQYRDSRDYIMTKAYKLSELKVMLNPISHGVFFPWLPRGGLILPTTLGSRDGPVLKF